MANGQADFAASKGATALGIHSEVVALDYHARKTQAYQCLVTRLQVHAAKILQHDRQRREEEGVLDEGKEQAQRIIVVPDCLPRPCFTEGEPLALLPLPPDCAIYDMSTSSGNNSCSEVSNISSLHIFWNATRWKCDTQARPTTWLELFALYRLWGGGPRDFDPHLPRPPLLPSIKAFTKASKALFKVIAEGGGPGHVEASEGQSLSSLKLRFGGALASCKS